MTAAVVRFPSRRSAAVFICAERGGDGWLAIAGAHGWLFGSLAEAQRRGVLARPKFRPSGSGGAMT